MSNAALSWAFSRSMSRSADKFLLVALANYADENAVCFPSQTKLAGDTALDRKTIIAALQRLLDQGLIADTGARKGVTDQIVVYRLIGVSGTPTTHYTYRTTDPATGEFYLGKRSWDGDPQADTYRGSGKWVRQAINDGRLLIREVLACFDTAQAALDAERRLFVEFQSDLLCRNEGTPQKHAQRSKQIAQDNLKLHSEIVPNFPVNGPVFPTQNSPKFPMEQSRFSVEQSQNSLITVPKTGHGTTIEPLLTLTEPPVRPPDPLPEGMRIWNSICGQVLARVEKVSDDRRRKFGKRFREDLGSSMPRWKQFCEAVVANDFLTGGGNRGWKADFDWVLEPKHMTKILEASAQKKVSPASSQNSFLPGGF